ncbi:MAG TPA: NeuD/PglB/VioB family sugar acetyltransferase [Humidesulfovibrio sp.]|uniref:NeuD/PglB/VioB family sugar acetyltransferase n=1 Tax=Humidesulfovibrio sp. TaxID=2910988 RepID=UPI002B828865|nr:NeuD/PglB/VioB family sugar acetyltransferase [Humidesulfovibrio sp.]HWR03147.1 NeuD/PglB/VioB family sugar acetyltransferase [Humidesulfovibrio sp.]
MHSAKPTKIVLIGAGGNSLEALDAICAGREAGLPISCVGILDDNPELTGQNIFGVPVLGRVEDAGRMPDVRFVLGIGSVTGYRERHLHIDRAGLSEDRFVSVIHPSAVISPHASIGAGSIILQNAVVCSSAVVGRHVLVLPNTTVNHNCVVEDYACLGGHVCVSGNVRIGKSAYIGSGSSILSNVRIGDEALVGLGAVVIRDVDPRTVVVGNPAKFLRTVG